MASVNLIDDLAIVQGKTYEKFDLLFFGDYSNWIPKAHIRRKLHYLDVYDDFIVEFEFPILTYNPTTHKTFLSPRLSAENTALIPPTVYQGTGKLTDCYVWDLELKDPNTNVVIGLDWGWVQVKPEVTVYV